MIFSMFSMNELFKRFITSIAIVGLFGGAFFHSVLLFSFLLLAVLIIIVFFEWPKLMGSMRWLHFVMITALYPTLPIVALICLNIKYHSINIILPLLPFLIAWTADTFGYLVGKAIGRHKVCPSISPGKSWEGLFGSIIGVYLVNLFMFSFIKIKPFSFISKSFFLVGIVSLVLTIVAFLGGIFVSFLKRKRGLKDTGHVLPGHGGFLDRFDSVFFTVIAIWAIIASGFFIK